MFRSGFVAVTGRPNVGKSTLINSLVGFKAAIVSDKPQTTRNRIQAVLNRDHSQIIFLDTPGIQRPQNKLGDFMLWSAQNSWKEVDAILMVVDGISQPGGGDRFLVNNLQGVTAPVFLILNKADLLRPNQIERRLESYRQLGSFEGAFAVSALKGGNLELVAEELEKCLPPGPQYFPPDMVTDQPEKLVVSEIIREKLLELTREEVPFSVAVNVEQMKKRPGQELIDVYANVFVEKESHKSIIIGKQGSLLKRAGSLARKELELLLGSRIYLDLWVKVRRDWKDQVNFLRELGLQRE